MTPPKDKEIDQTIDKLCCELKPVKCQCPYSRMGVWLAIVLTYTIAMAALSGASEMFIEKVTNRDFVFEIGLALATGIAATMMTFWLTLPDSERFEKFLAVPATLFAVHVFWMLDRLFMEGSGPVPAQALGNCWMDTALMAGLPAAAVIVLIRKGASVRPYWLAFNAVLAISAFGWMGIRFSCPFNTVGKAYFVNFLPFMAGGLVLGFFARKLFRW